MLHNSVVLTEVSKMPIGRFALLYPVRQMEPILAFIAGGVHAADPMRWTVLLDQQHCSKPEEVPFAFEAPAYGAHSGIDITEQVALRYDVSALKSAKLNILYRQSDLAGSLVLSGNKVWLGFRDLSQGRVVRLVDLVSGLTLDSGLFDKISGIVIENWALDYLHRDSTGTLVASEVMRR
jgi:hypothetical protein